MLEWFAPALIGLVVATVAYVLLRRIIGGPRTRQL